MDVLQSAPPSKAERPTRKLTDLRIIGPLFIVLVLGGIFFPRPKFVSCVVFLIWSIGQPHRGYVDASEDTLALYSTLLVILPSAMFLIALLLATWAPAMVRWIRNVVRVFLVLAIIDVPLSAFIGIFGAAAVVGIQAFVAIAIVSTDLFLLRGLAALQRGEFHVSRKSILLGVPATLVALWSILNVPLIMFQAVRIAGDSPYCRVEYGITNDSPPSKGYAPVNSIFDLRGTRLYTTATGYSDYSPPPYFHAVLRVQDKDRREFWNWSIAHARFESRSDQFYGFSNFCDVDRHFFLHLRWY
jgi:hypothetical protein